MGSPHQIHSSGPFALGTGYWKEPEGGCRRGMGEENSHGGIQQEGIYMGEGRSFNAGEGQHIH